MNSTDAALSTASSTPKEFAESWVHPDDLYMWELEPYIARYGAHWSSYNAHYYAAFHGKRVSVERMEYMVSAIAAARIRAAGTGAKLDERLANRFDKGIRWRR